MWSTLLRRGLLPCSSLALCIVSVCAAWQEPAPPPATEKWIPMFDGKTLNGWKETPFTKHGKVIVENGTIILGRGYMTGINWAGEFPTSNYAVRLEAARLDGSDFFAGITFPVFDSFCTWINGGWGGTLVGLSSLDGLDAAENDASFQRNFEKGRWYKLRLEVTGEWMAMWLDEKQIINVPLAGREVGLRAGEIDLSKPFGIASYDTAAALRNIEYRRLD